MQNYDSPMHGSCTRCLFAGWSAHELVFSGLSWPTLDKPFWLDVGNNSLSLRYIQSWTYNLDTTSEIYTTTQILRVAADLKMLQRQQSFIKSTGFIYDYWKVMFFGFSNAVTFQSLMNDIHSFLPFHTGDFRLHYPGRCPCF